MKNSTILWNPSTLNSLIEKSGVTFEQAARGCGISVAAFANYRHGRIPSLSAVLGMADYFDVPVDVLLGRCDSETSKSVLEGYHTHFMSLRRTAWETYLSTRPTSMKYSVDGYEAPWPYNLLDRLVQSDSNPNRRDIGEDVFWKDILTEDQEAGLEKALELLNDQEREALFLHFHEGFDLLHVGLHFSVTRERARQIISKAIRKLRHPSRFRLVFYGLDGVNLFNESRIRRLALEADLHNFDEANRYLDCLRDGLYQRASALARINGKLVNQEESILNSDMTMPSGTFRSMTVEDMDLSVRTYNCIKRAKINSIGDLIDHLRLGNDPGGLPRIRNLGRKSLDEIITKVYLITGEDFRSDFFLSESN